MMDITLGLGQRLMDTDKIRGILNDESLKAHMVDLSYCLLLPKNRSRFG